MTTRQARIGDTVAVHYTGTLADGTVFDSSTERDPIEFTIGAGQVIAGFERDLPGMAVGQSATFTIAPEDAYGDHRPDMVHVLERQQLPPDLDIALGNELVATDPSGSQMNLRVVGIEGDQVHLDANHPLAGQALTFEITLVRIAE